MNLAYMTVLTPDEMINSPAVGLSFGDRVLGRFSFLIPLGVALSTFGCALSIQFGVTRLCFVAGRGEILKLRFYEGILYHLIFQRDICWNHFHTFM